MRESKIESYLRKQSKQYGFICYKWVSPGTNGVPDRILVGHGLTLFVETKAPGKVPRKQQELRHKELRQHGARVYVADTMESIDTLLKDIAKELGITKQITPHTTHSVVYGPHSNSNQSHKTLSQPDNND